MYSVKLLLVIVYLSWSNYCNGAIEQWMQEDDALVELELVDANRAVATPPMITRQPETRNHEMIFEKRRNVVLECEGTGEPFPEFRWIKNDRHYDPSAVDSARVATQIDKGTIIISRPKASDEGLYQCIIQNPHGVAVSNKVYLRYATLGDFEKIDNTPIHRVKNGQSLTMNCVPPQGIPKPQIFWSIKSKEGIKAVKLSDRISMDLDPGNLHFVYVEPEDMMDGAPYVCNAYNPSLNKLKEGAYQKLEIINPSDPIPRIEPQFLYMTPKLTVGLLDDDFEMKCIFGGHPVPKYEWRRLGTNLLLPENRHVYQSFGQSLIIRNLQFEDAGEYECSASNGQGIPKKRKIILSVQSRPYWIEKPESRHAGQGDTVQFICRAGGTPEPIIRWYINGRAVLAEAPREQVTNEIIQSYYYINDEFGGADEDSIETKAKKLNKRWLINRNNFTIYNLDKEQDTMVIQCNASNIHGYIFQNAFLNVLAEAPVFREEPHPLYEFIEGNVGVIHCDTFAAPRPITRWFKDGKELTGGRFDMQPNGNLHIARVLFDDVGSYMCLSSNKYGTIKGTTQVVVKQKTKILNRPQDLEVRKGTTATFRCSAVADKSVRLVIEWQKHGEDINYALSQRIIKHPLDNTLLITNTLDDDTADYTCIATAYSKKQGDDVVLDVVTATANLTVQSPPNEVKNVKLKSCDRRSANVEWTPMGDNRAPILNYIIQFNTSFEPEIFVDLAVKVPPTAREANLQLSPWANYTFRVIAKNKIGNSIPSEVTKVCLTPPATPDKHPENVRGNGTRPDNMVVWWTPMTYLEQNGPGFRYLVRWKRHSEPDSPWQTQNINDARNSSYVVWGTYTYEAYDIQVLAVNVNGEAPVTPVTVVGYSGEDKPVVIVQNLRLVDVLGSRSASFTWSPVDPSPDNIKGKFLGYKIQAWVASEGMENVREVRAGPNDTMATIDVLQPYSDILAQIFVYNNQYDGDPGQTISFKTPGGTSGSVANFVLTPLSSNAMLLEWDYPLEPNGIIIGYRIAYQTVHGTKIGKMMFREPDIYNPLQFSVKLAGLEAETKYRVTIWPLTYAGVGEPYFIERSTLTGGIPAMPTLTVLGRNESHVNISWFSPQQRDRQAASIFYVKYRRYGQEQWHSTVDEVINEWITVSDLEPGTSYQMSVIAVNDEFESGSAPIDVWTQGSRSEIGDDSAVASAGWFVGMMIALVLLICIAVLVCLVKRWRDSHYHGVPDSDPDDTNWSNKGLGNMQREERERIAYPDNEYSRGYQPEYRTAPYPPVQGYHNAALKDEEESGPSGVSRTPDPPVSAHSADQSQESDLKPPLDSDDSVVASASVTESEPPKYTEEIPQRPKKRGGRRPPPPLPAEEPNEGGFDTFV